jgi:DNA-binding NtrC family response regulator
VLSATNRNLYAVVKAKTFREDLYYRLAEFPIPLPALRERREDIPLLASLFLAANAKSSGKSIGGFDADAMDALVRFDWPGNGRQLRNEIARAVALAADGQTIALAHLWAAVDGSGQRITKPASSATPSPVRDDFVGAFQTLAEARSDCEERHIAAALARTGGNMAEAARLLGISRVALHKRVKKQTPR